MGEGVSFVLAFIHVLRRYKTNTKFVLKFLPFYWSNIIAFCAFGTFKFLTDPKNFRNLTAEPLVYTSIFT
jgi:hypothetical protein